jgi:hypothetical protein
MKMARSDSLSQRDSAGSFRTVVLQCGKTILNVHAFGVSPRGMTFQTDRPFASFTHLSVQLEIPQTPASYTIRCEGVVVECRGSHTSKIYYVTVAFVDLSAADQKRLALAGALFIPMVSTERAWSTASRPI